MKTPTTSPNRSNLSLDWLRFFLCISSGNKIAKLDSFDLRTNEQNFVITMLFLLCQKQNVERAKFALMTDKSDSSNLSDGEKQSDHILMMVAYKKWEKILREVSQHPLPFSLLIFLLANNILFIIGVLFNVTSLLAIFLLLSGFIC